MKHCANPKCGKLLAPKPNERPDKYKRRKYCGRQCATNVYGYKYLGRAS